MNKTPNSPCEGDTAFLIARYTKKELSLMYCPNHSPQLAGQNLYRWMHKCAPLMEELRALGYDSRRHHFHKREVELIVKYLGEP